MISLVNLPMLSMDWGALSVASCMSVKTKGQLNKRMNGHQMYIIFRSTLSSHLLRNHWASILFARNCIHYHFKGL